MGEREEGLAKAEWERKGKLGGRENDVFGSMMRP